MEKLLSLLKFCEKCVKIYEKLCKGLENSEKSGVVQRQHVELEKTLKNDALDAKIGVDTGENELRKRSENRVLQYSK